MPHYDFNWQLVYEMGQPRLLPRGTMLRADATFDNSPNNRFNPDAKAEVRWGDQDLGRDDGGVLRCDDSVEDRSDKGARKTGMLAP